jgi:hypothetical protein
MSRSMIIAALACLLVGGCVQSAFHQPEGPIPEPQHPSDAGYLQKAVVARDVDPPLPTAVENAIALQDKYARALEDLRRGEEHNHALSDENRKLAETAAHLQADLAKTQQELSEANAILIQMRQEIEKWKYDVLGYRDEMRKANQAQIEALGKVLSLLGAEAGGPAGAEAATAQPDPAATAAATAAADKLKSGAKPLPPMKTVGKATPK